MIVEATLCNAGHTVPEAKDVQTELQSQLGVETVVIGNGFNSNSSSIRTLPIDWVRDDVVPLTTSKLGLTCVTCGLCRRKALLVWLTGKDR